MTGGDIDGVVYAMYDSNKNFIGNFAYYDDMKYYLETGIIL